MKLTRRVQGHSLVHSLTCSALLASLARSVAIIHSLAVSLTRSGAYGKEIHVSELIGCRFHTVSAQSALSLWRLRSIDSFIECKDLWS